MFKINKMQAYDLHIIFYQLNEKHVALIVLQETLFQVIQVIETYCCLYLAVLQ